MTDKLTKKEREIDIDLKKFNCSQIPVFYLRNVKIISHNSPSKYYLEKKKKKFLTKILIMCHSHRLQAGYGRKQIDIRRGNEVVLCSNRQIRIHHLF